MKASIGQYIRTVVNEPDYFYLGQVGKVVNVIVDNEAPDGYAYYVDFGLVDGENIFWFLDCDEFELYEVN